MRSAILLVMLLSAVAGAVAAEPFRLPVEAVATEASPDGKG